MFGLSLMNTIFRQIIKFSDIVGSLSDFFCGRKKGWQSSVDPNQLAEEVFPQVYSAENRSSSERGMFRKSLDTASNFRDD